MVQLLCRIISWLCFRVRVVGQPPARLPERTVLIANHQSFLDGVMVQALLRQNITWIVHSQIARLWLFRLPLKLVPHLLVDTAHPMAMKKVVQLIEQGHPVMIFPEGKITTTGGLMKVYEGPAFLAAKTDATVVPVFVDGAMYSHFTRLIAPFPKKWRPQVTLTWFAPRRLPMPEAPTGKLRRRQATENMQRLLQQMLLEAHPRPSLFEAFLDAVDLHGRGRMMLEDVRPKKDTYGELLRGALALGRLVSRLSEEGERVGVLMPNAGPTVMLLFGMFAMRRVPAMLNYTAGVDGMQSACTLAGLRTILTSHSFIEKAKLGDKIGQLRDVRIVYLEDLRPQFRLADKLWLMLWALRFPRRVTRPARPEDPAIVLFTSGSEGKPKGVVLSHGAFMANVAQIKSVIEFSCRDRFLVALPLFHSFGLTAGLLLPMLNGVPIFLYPSPLHYRMIPEIAYDAECTVMFGTPTFLAKYAAFANVYDFHRVRYVLAGAEKLSEEVRQLWINKFGIRLIEGYGATECAPALTLNTPMGYRAGAVGRLLPGIEHKLEPVPGIERGGLLHVRGPNMMLGYLRHERPGVLESLAASGGWYNTGDVVEVDADGFLYIQARVKRFAKVAGEMVSLEVVESIAAAASPKSAHAATAVTDPMRGETIVLFTEDPALRRDQLMSAARRLGLPEVAVARRVEVVEDLPRLGTGKCDYVALKSWAESGVAQAAV